jgi:transcriptional regulator with XRE-family HTH domain
MEKNFNIGANLAQIRKVAGLSQPEIAKRTGLSTVAISRIENESTKLPEKDIISYLDAIGTEEARKFIAYFTMDWENTTKPPFNHPNLQILTQIEKSLHKCNQLLKKIIVTNPYHQQLTFYRNNLIEIYNYLIELKHKIAFIGKIGVGKTEAICRLLGLLLENQPVLEVSSGRTTICEVSIKLDSKFNISIIPLSDDEVYTYVGDFCDFIWESVKKSEAEDTLKSEQDTVLITKEIERCIRNMSGLNITSSKSADGKSVIDPAKELAKGFTGSKDEFRSEIWLKMNIQKRKQTEIIYEVSTIKDGYSQLKEDFKSINNGKHPNFCIPKKIIVTIPVESINILNEYEIEIVDTKGIDESEKRADIESHFTEPRTITAICSTFNDAPDERTLSLFNRAINSGYIEQLKQKSILLVLAKNEEAKNTKSFDGDVVENEQEGYVVRGHDINTILIRNCGISNYPIKFYNSRTESSSHVIESLNERIQSIRLTYSSRAQEIIDLIENIELTSEKESAIIAFREVYKNISTWIESNRDTISIDKLDELENSLTKAIEDIRYAGVIRATVNRNGEYYDLNYYYQIGYGCRVAAFNALNPIHVNLKTIIEHLMKIEDLKIAKGFLTELHTVVVTGFENIYQNIQNLGQVLFRDPMITSNEKWSDMKREWGQGPGYKRRIEDKSKNWMTEEDLMTKKEIIKNNIILSFQKFLATLEVVIKNVPVEV